MCPLCNASVMYASVVLKLSRHNEISVWFLVFEYYLGKAIGVHTDQISWINAKHFNSAKNTFR
jgi:hypothetical protein